MPQYSTIIVGAGAAGMMAAIAASRHNHKVLLLEKLPQIGLKLKATGGGRCNLSNTLEVADFITAFGREGRFMLPALERFDRHQLQAFFASIGVKTHAPDGFRIFPVGHQSSTILDALKSTIKQRGVTLLTNQSVTTLLVHQGEIVGVENQHHQTFYAPRVIIATGGNGYPQLGAEGDGYRLAQQLNHTVATPYPAMLPLITKERWGATCRADTLPKVTLKIALKKYQKYHAKGDLIFTKQGIRGPVVLDFAREITPLLAQRGEVPILLNLTQGRNEEQLHQYLKTQRQHHPDAPIIELLTGLLPHAVANALCAISHIDPTARWRKIAGASRDLLIKQLAWTPLTVIGHEGFAKAMITRGGIKLNEVDPETLQSKKVKGVYFCGEVLNLDGPCGGYNLQWAFASGYLAGSRG